MSKGIYSGSKCGFDPNAFCIVGNLCGGKKFCYKKTVFFPIVKVHKILELTSSPFAFPWASMSQLGKSIFEVTYNNLYTTSCPIEVVARRGPLF